MAVAKEVEVQRQCTRVYNLERVLITNGKGASKELNRARAVKILERFPEGRFNHSQYPLPTTLGQPFSMIGSNDDLEIKEILYAVPLNERSKGQIDHVVLSYDEYVQLDRPEFVSMEDTQRITSYED